MPRTRTYVSAHRYDAIHALRLALRKLRKLERAITHPYSAPLLLEKLVDEAEDSLRIARRRLIAEHKEHG